MRCKACDVKLQTYDTHRKDSNGDFLDVCSKCNSISVKTISSYDSDKYKWDLEEQGESDIEDIMAQLT